MRASDLPGRFFFECARAAQISFTALTGMGLNLKR